MKKFRRIVTIPDIHGDVYALKKSLALGKVFDQPPSKLIFLGDYVDDRPGAGKVIDYLYTVRELLPHTHVIFLAGNHDVALQIFVQKCLNAQNVTERKIILEWYYFESGYGSGILEEGMHQLQQEKKLVDCDDLLKHQFYYTDPDVIWSFLKTRDDLIQAFCNWVIDEFWLQEKYKNFLKELELLHFEKRFLFIHAGLSIKWLLKGLKNDLIVLNHDFCRALEKLNTGELEAINPFIGIVEGSKLGKISDAPLCWYVERTIQSADTLDLLEMRKLTQDMGAQIVVHGHNHIETNISSITHIENLYFINSAIGVRKPIPNCIEIIQEDGHFKIIGHSLPYPNHLLAILDLM